MHNFHQSNNSSFVSSSATWPEVFRFTSSATTNVAEQGTGADRACAAAAQRQAVSRFAWSRKQMDLASHIKKIGHDMVRCNIHCPGIALNQPEGILPRCLYLETEGRADGRGSVIVGINPGRSKPQEREFYQSYGQTYEQEVRYWERYIYNHPYYKQLRQFVNELGFGGAILWTELVKCENASAESGLPPLQTFRTCASTYLQKELEEVPNDWVLLAVSKDSYNALAYMFPSRPVIGVPHPTGSRGQFHRLFGAERRLLPEVKAQVGSIANGVRGETVWLSLRKHAANSAMQPTVS